MWRYIIISTFLMLFNACTKTLQLKQPESAVSTQEFIYVSNVNGNPVEKDANGYISKLYKNGEVCENMFIQNLNAPKGLCLVGNTLFVADIDKVVGFNILTKKQEFSFDFSFSKTQFLNDICWDGYDKLFVSASDINEIFAIDIQTKIITVLQVKDSLYGSNGLCFKDSVLYVVEMGNDSLKGGLAKITFSNNKHFFSRILSNVGILDGIFYHKDKLYFSDWQTNNNTSQAQIHIYDMQTQQLSNFPLEKKYNGIADISYDVLHQRILAPIMEENKLFFFELN